jgi:hypothetical protein
MVAAAIFVLIIVGSGSFVIVPLLLEREYLQALIMVVTFVGVMFIYLILLYVLSLIFAPILRLIRNAVFRRLISGSVPYPSVEEKKPSFFRRIVTRVERQLGFAPR